MSEFIPDEIEDIVQAMSQKKLTEGEKAKIPLLPPASFKKIAKLALSPLNGQQPRPLDELTSKEMGNLELLKAEIEVFFGKTRLTLKELAALEKGSLLPLEDLCDDLVDIYANGCKIGRGEIVAVDGRYGIKIVSFTKN